MTVGPFASGVSGDDDVDALAAGQHREGLQAHVGEMVLEVRRRLLHQLEIEADVGIEVEHDPVGLLDIGDLEPQPWNSIVPIWTQAISPAPSST